MMWCPLEALRFYLRRKPRMRHLDSNVSVKILQAFYEMGIWELKINPYREKINSAHQPELLNHDDGKGQF